MPHVDWNLAVTIAAGFALGSLAVQGIQAVLRALGGK